MVRVLFVCLGNICRSPMAEAVFRHLVEQQQLSDKIIVDSAGTAAWHEGKPPHHGTRQKLDELQIAYDGMTARQIKSEDFQSFDYIIAMDEDNLSNLNGMFDGNDRVVVRKLMSFVEQPKEENVPDPYYTGNFDYTYELIEEASKSLLNYIQERHNF